MAEESTNSRLSGISTRQTEFRHAHHADAILRTKAQEAIIQRYQKAIQRYLRAALRSPTAAEEVFQRFAEEFLGGRLQGWDAARGRFRNYLKAVLIRLVNDYRKEQRDARLVAQGRQPRGRQDESVHAAFDHAQKPASDPEESDDFDEAWRDELLAHTWAALCDVERQRGQPFFTVLRLRAENPKITSKEMAKRLTEQLKPSRLFTDEGIRKTLERARERFANLLIDEVAGSLGVSTLDELEQELIDLRLLGYHYCRDVMLQRREAQSSSR